MIAGQPEVSKMRCASHPIGRWTLYASRFAVSSIVWRSRSIALTISGARKLSVTSRENRAHPHSWRLRETRVVRQSGRFCPECLLRDLGGTTKTDDCAHGLRILGSGAVARRMVFPDKAMPAGPKVKLAESSDEMARFIVAAVNRARLVETPRSAISAVY